MSENQNLKRFLYESCVYLNIAISKTPEDGVFQLYIPEELKEEFPDEDILISFQKKEDDDIIFINAESYFIKKLARIVRKKSPAIIKAKQVISLSKLQEKLKDKEIKQMESDIEYHLLSWYKVTIRGYMIHEHIFTYNYNFQNEEIKNLGFKQVSDFLFLTEDNFEYDVEKVDEAVMFMMYEMHPQIVQHVGKMQEKNNVFMDKELERVNHYYQQLEIELENKIYNVDDYDLDDIDSLNIEKENLLEQIHYKYNINLNDVSIEPLIIILVKQEIEKAEWSNQIINAKYTSLDKIK